MINLAISILAGVAVLLLSNLLFESSWAGIFPFLVVVPLVYFLLARRINKKLEVVLLDVQKHMQKLQTVRSPKQRDLAIDRAIEILKQGFRFKHWQFLIAAQLNGQIGQLYYAQKKFDRARPYLENGYVRDWIATTMLGCIQFKKKDYDEMKKTFEKAARYNKKEALMWSIYGWCLWKSGDRDEAQNVLNRGYEATKDDRISGNIDNLRNKKKLKMRGWKEPLVSIPAGESAATQNAI